MTDKPHPTLEHLANGINFALRALNGGKEMEFLLVLVKPSGDDTVTLNSITAITDPAKIASIGQHLVDMATAQINAQGLDPHNDDEVQGHA